MTTDQPAITLEDRLNATAMVRAWARRDLEEVRLVQQHARPEAALAVLALASALAGALGEATNGDDTETVLNDITHDLIAQQTKEDR